MLLFWHSFMTLATRCFYRGEYLCHNSYILAQNDCTLWNY